MGLLREFPYAFKHGEGETTYVSFEGQVVDGVCISPEYDGGGHAG